MCNFKTLMICPRIVLAQVSCAYAATLYYVNLLYLNCSCLPCLHNKWLMIFQMYKNCEDNSYAIFMLTLVIEYINYSIVASSDLVLLANHLRFSFCYLNQRNLIRVD
ncbi:hypothetical protein RND81_03G028500 [Saponaria officinalis]|uniref:Uncharacterized protein n=1 Tax=Saponaria officinalis TaxID=3572 RepID=A0AAW1M417_SAPOF